MRKNRFFNIYNFIILLVFLVTLGVGGIVMASPNIEKNIKEDLTVHFNALNNGNIEKYYDMYNTRRLDGHISKNKFYEKIKRAKDVIEEEKETFQKYKFNMKLNNATVLNKINKNIFLVNLEVTYRYREDINSTKTTTITSNYLTKIIDIGNQNYKILLPFNSLDKDFTESILFKNLEKNIKDKQAEKIEKERELEDSLNINNTDEEADDTEVFEDESSIIIIEDSNLDTNSENTDTTTNTNIIDNETKDDSNNINDDNNNINNENETTNSDIENINPN